MKLNERLRELRTERELRLKDIASVAGISVPYLSDLERGRTAPSLSTLRDLATTYDMTVQDLLVNVEDYGEGTSLKALPLPLQALAEDTNLNVSSDWIYTLSIIQHNGKRLKTKQDYYEIYLHLRRILGDK